MRLSLLSIAFFAVSSLQALSIPSLHSLSSRQAPSNVDSSIFLRRGYHSSGVLNGTVYIDGGKFSYLSGGSVVYQYSSTLIAISLADDWTNKTVNLQSIEKPNSVPNLSAGGMWIDSENNVLYIGFAGLSSGFGDAAPQSNGLWQFSPTSGTWTNLNNTADKFTNNYTRSYNGLVASGNGKGYSLGGYVNGGNASGLLTYDFTSHELTNTTVTDASTDGGVVQMGRMVFVPNFGPSGVVVSIGGDQLGKVTNNTDDLLSMNSVQIFDPASGDWYDQPVTGNIPPSRKEFCLAGVASKNSTYEIFLYAGWNGHLGGGEVPYDAVYVLTLPGFYWVHAGYPEHNPRHGLTCESVGGGQMLTIGGLDTTQIDKDDLYKGPFNTADPFTYGLGIFDISTLTWKSSYSSKQTVYTPYSDILDFYQTNGRLSALNSTSLKDLFSAENFTGVPTSSTSGTLPSSPTSSSSSSPSSSSASKSTNTGAIVGGVVGGVAGVVAVLAAFYFLRRRKQKTNSSEGANPGGNGYNEGYSYGYNKAAREFPGEPELPPELGNTGICEASVGLPSYGNTHAHELG